MFPGKECRSTASMALQKVDIAGEKRVAWKKAIRAAICGSGHKALAAWDGTCADDELIFVCGSAACEKVFTGWDKKPTGGVSVNFPRCLMPGKVEICGSLLDGRRVIT